MNVSWGVAAQIMKDLDTVGAGTGRGRAWRLW